MFEWILHVIGVGGYTGVFFLMVLENLFPPIPSEVIIPLAGYSAASGSMNLGLVILCASLGAMVGALPWYFLARQFGLARLRNLSNRYGRWLALSPSDIDASEMWFKKHGPLAVLFGRLVPTVRTLISVPAGLARMPIKSFLIYSFAGSLLWTALLALLGFWLGSQNHRVATWLGPISDGIIIFIVSIYIYRVVTFRKKN